MTDRQTDHATEKCVGMGGITCAARMVPPNNDGKKVKVKRTVPLRSVGGVLISLSRPLSP